MVQEYLVEELIGYVIRDSTEIDSREKAARKAKDIKVPRKRGRPVKSKNRPPSKPKRLQLQLGHTAAEAVCESPKRCDHGIKKNSKGYKLDWI